MRFCMDLCLAVVLIQIAWTDIRTMMIPDRVLVPLMILAGLSVFTEPEIPFTARLIGKMCIRDSCFRCLEHCDPATTPYCITKALINAAEGKIDDALLFCGSNAYRCEKIETVPEVMAALCGE